MLHQPVTRFGIVAAMSKNRVIGVNGKLPWSLPQDRHLFENVTRDKVIVLGRKSYHDDDDPHGSDGSSLSHVRWSIVLSKSANPVDYEKHQKVKIVRSFSEALHVARMLAEKDNKDTKAAGLDCWICGGEGIYEEALRHSSARELRLSFVDTDINMETPDTKITRFPAKYRWDHIFKEVSKEQFPQSEDNPHAFTHRVYHRKKAITCAGVV